MGRSYSWTCAGGSFPVSTAADLVAVRADLQGSPSFSVKLVARHRRTGKLGRQRQGRPPGTGKLAPYRDFLMRRVRETPDITMPELAAELEARHGVGLDPASCRGSCARPGSAIKKTLLAVERAPSDVAKFRDVWIHKRQPIMRAMPHRLVFIDETSTTTKLTRLRGRAAKGRAVTGAARSATG